MDLRGLSGAFALAGVGGLAGNFVLTARLRVIERALGGLDRLYLFHRRLAVASLAFLAVHGALTLAVIVSGARPDVPKIVLGSVAFAGLALGVVASTRGKRRMSHETFLWIQRAFGPLFAVAIVHVFVGGTASFRIRAYVMSLAVVAGCAYVYRAVLGRVAVPRLRYRVDAVNRLDADVMEIVLSPTGETLRYRAGQFAFIGVRSETLTTEAHPFSITSAPDEPHLRFMIKALGDWTSAIQSLVAGTDARIEGPYGAFWQRGADNPRQIWIAGGVGVAAFLSMARSLRPDDPRQIDLYYCTEGPHQAHFIDELFRIADGHLNLRVVPVRKVSLGRIDANDIEGASREVAAKEIFICGPPAMMTNLERQFVALGVPPSQIHFEDFSFL